MGRVSPIESNGPCIFAQHAVNHIGMQEPASLKALAIVAHRPEEWSLKIIAVFGEF
jgi:hypothetical protein